MEKALQFLGEHKTHAVATIDDEGNPRVRFLETILVKDNYVYYCTFPRKNVYLQLKAHPAAEVVATDGKNSVRARGTMKFDVPEEISRPIFDGCEFLKQIFPAFDKDAFIRLAVSEFNYFDMESEGEQPVIIPVQGTCTACAGQSRTPPTYDCHCCGECPEDCKCPCHKDE